MSDNIRTMELLGVDFWDNPVYKCIETGMLWKDLAPRSEKPELYSCGNSFDGEPCWPIQTDLQILFKTKYKEDPNKFKYMMLGRLQADCKYYLGNGNRHKKYLYYQDEHEHIDKMKELYNSFTEEERPEWLTYEDISLYEKLMLNK